jgi:hypothetical protein
MGGGIRPSYFDTDAHGKNGYELIILKYKKSNP